MSVINRKFFLSAAFALCSMLGLQAAVAQPSASMLCGAIALPGMSCPNSNSSAAADSTGSGLPPMTAPSNPVVINLQSLLQPPPAGCPSQLVYWRGTDEGASICEATLPRGGQGQIINVSSYGNGIAQFQCFNGSWNKLSSYCDLNMP